uniref:Nuclear hormone receptor family member nhr-47 n=1 Tax=Parascaris univalens TaxID=6257 RepID=A0A915CKS5_PARUN
MAEKLPPGTLCVVCEDLATGNHYSVPSCNGCKTFFRRAVVNNRTFACMGTGNCPVNKDSRNVYKLGWTATVVPDPMLDRLTTLENNFTLLLSRAEIDPYASLDDALAAPSRFARPIDVKITDPIAAPKPGKDQHKMPFWRSRIIALYIDWAKTFPVFRNLPYSDKVALITNHASSYMIMCEAFRTPEHINDKIMQPDGYCFTRRPPQDSLFLKNGGPSTLPDGDDTASSSASESDAGSHITAQMSAHPFSGGLCAVDLDAFQGGIGGVQSTCGASSVGSHSAFESTKEEENMHTFFDPKLLHDGQSNEVGVRSVVDVPPAAHYPTVGSLSGLTPVMAAVIDYVMKPFRRLNISTTEFATLQAIMFFDPDTDGLDSASQRNVAAEQKKLLTALYKHICMHYEPNDASDRYAAILLRIPTIRKVAAKKNESLQIIDMFNLFSLNSLVKETALGIRSPNATIPAVVSSMTDDIKPCR